MSTPSKEHHKKGSRAVSEDAIRCSKDKTKTWNHVQNEEQKKRIEDVEDAKATIRVEDERNAVGQTPLQSATTIIHAAAILSKELSLCEQEHEDEVTRLLVKRHHGVRCESASEIGQQLRYYKCSRIETAAATCDMDSEYSSTSEWCESCRDRVGPYVEEINELKAAHAEELRKAREEHDQTKRRIVSRLSWLITQHVNCNKGSHVPDITSELRRIIEEHRPTSQSPEA